MPKKTCRCATTFFWFAEYSYAGLSTTRHNSADSVPTSNDSMAPITRGLPNGLSTSHSEHFGQSLDLRIDRGDPNGLPLTF